MTILNQDALISHGNRRGREAALKIIAAGLQVADPYGRIGELVRVECDANGMAQTLVVGCADFEPTDAPYGGDLRFDLDQLGRVLVFGAGKGAQRAALALEDILGDHLAGDRLAGHVIDKKGGSVILQRIGVTLGAHPVPDADCAEGCRQILAMTENLHENDLVFTIGSSGFSSLLSMPAPGLSLADIQRTIYLMQIERGAPTSDLSPVRNHLDAIKGGRLARRIQPAMGIHLLAKPAESYERLIHENTWVHTFPDHSTFADAVAMLRKWDAWEAAPESVRRHLLQADPAQETVKPDQYLQWPHRIYCVSPGEQGHWPTPRRVAEALGFKAVMLAKEVRGEAGQVGAMMGAIAKTIEAGDGTLQPPVALFTSGEMLVTVGEEMGIGGRNQEYCLAAALAIAGSERIVVAAADTDGTDGPGSQYVDGVDLPTLAGALVDGQTVEEAQALGIDLREALRHHNTTPALNALHSGILATQTTGLLDLGVALVM